MGRKGRCLHGLATELGNGVARSCRMQELQFLRDRLALSGEEFPFFRKCMLCLCIRRCQGLELLLELSLHRSGRFRLPARLVCNLPCYLPGLFYGLLRRLPSRFGGPLFLRLSSLV